MSPSRGRARSESAPKAFTGNACDTLPPPLAPTHSRASFWRRDEDKLLSPSNSNHSRPWHTMFDISPSTQDKPRRHSVATGTPTKECKESKHKDADAPTIPTEQMENWEITRKRVAQAASSVLGTTALIAHEVLLTSVDLVELAPVPGLQAAARTLLQIWACLQQVDSNRLQCLRLTEHCADILLSVRQEVYEAGDEVAEELKLPFDKLTESFNDVHALLVKQAGRPFLKRYLKRDEISRQLHQCDIGLQEALGMFSISIQIRILKQVQLAEARRQHDTQELLRGVANLSQLSQHGYPLQPPSYASSTAQNTAANLDFPTPRVSQIATQTLLDSLPAPDTSSAPPRPPFPYAASNLLMLSASKSVNAYTSASASSQTLNGLPASSSHTSLSSSVSIKQTNEQSLEAYSWKHNSKIASVVTNTNVTSSTSSAQVQSSSRPVSPKDTETQIIPSVSITPSSRPSTATSSSTASVETGVSTPVGGIDVINTTQAAPKQMSKTQLPQPPIQLIPTKSSIEAAGAMLEAIQREGKVTSESNGVEVSSLEASSASTSTSTVTPGSSAGITSTSETKSTSSTTASHSTNYLIPPALLPSASSLPPTEILPTLLSLTRHQAALDAESDYADLRGVMRTALSKGSDVDIIKVLGVGLRKGKLGRGSLAHLDASSRENGGFGEDGMESIECGGLDAGEIAEAIKTLQRAHEAILERERWEAWRAQHRPQGVQEEVSTVSQVQVSHVTENSQKILQTEDGISDLDHRNSSISSRNKVFAGIKRRMSLQSSRSTTGLSLPSSLNEDIIHEEGEGGEHEGRRRRDSSVDERPKSRHGKGVGGGTNLMRSKTVSSSSTSSSASTHDLPWSRSQSGSGSGVSRTSGNGRHIREQDTLDKEFIETGIDALRRVSRSTAVRRRTNTKSREEVEDPARLLPSWTITRYEIEREEKIGVGFFSDVYKGTWRPPSVPSAPSYPYSATTPRDMSPSNSSYPYASRVVAIKVLAETTPRSLFLRETAIWKKLSHPNVLELYGASSASGDPPWFFVSPYMRNGSLAEFLRRGSTSIPNVSSRGSGQSRVPRGLILPGHTAFEVGGVKRLRNIGSTAAAFASEPAAIGLGLDIAPSIAHRSESLRASSAPSLPLYTDPSTHSSPVISVAAEGGIGANETGASAFEMGSLPREWDLVRYMHEIAKGMEYLHSQGVLHGDLKASNILVDDDIHCVISDFGQSEMRSEAYRISGTAPPHGTLRWQAPEIFTGSSNLLTAEMDVYAFAVCCTEILSLGRMPWPLYDDHQVLNHIMANRRPDIPPTCFTTPGLVNLIDVCWATDPFIRPSFSTVVAELNGFRSASDTPDAKHEISLHSDLKTLRSLEQPEHLQNTRYLPSPDMYPIQDTGLSTPPRNSHIASRRAFIHGTPSSSYSNSYANTSSSEDDSFQTANDVTISPRGPLPECLASTTIAASTASTRTALACTSTPMSSPPFAPSGVLPFSPTTPASSSSPLNSTNTTSPRTAETPSHAHTTLRHHIPKAGAQTRPSSSPTSSSVTSSLSEFELQPEGKHSFVIHQLVPDEGSGNKKIDEYDTYDSPSPANDLIAEAQNERRYRLLLVHEFHPSLTLPLWSPAPVALGAIGYLSKPMGEFVTLFNAFRPQDSTIDLVKNLPSVHGYGKFSTGTHRQDKRNAAQRSLDAIAGLLTFKGRAGNISKSVSRRYSYPLRAGHKAAHLCTETTMYRYMENLDAPKKWFKAHVDTVLNIFASQHQIQKEDLFFVIGTLDTRNMLCGQVHFNVFTSSKSRQPWGRFSTDTETPLELGGPSYHEPMSGNPVSAQKISPQDSYPWSTVLVARLRFRPDILEPTSL
ncbi:hypothetical protein C8R42DRAFT_650363 [Lentinula raphanica]|nr:hypothetical protein C8R42DRAFT_650363 [Lentinula raphanica]